MFMSPVIMITPSHLVVTSERNISKLSSNNNLSDSSGLGCYATATSYGVFLFRPWSLMNITSMFTIFFVKSSRVLKVMLSFI